MENYTWCAAEANTQSPSGVARASVPAHRPSIPAAAIPYDESSGCCDGSAAPAGWTVGGRLRALWAGGWATPQRVGAWQCMHHHIVSAERSGHGVCRRALVLYGCLMLRGPFPPHACREETFRREESLNLERRI